MPTWRRDRSSKTGRRVSTRSLALLRSAVSGRPILTLTLAVSCDCISWHVSLLCQHCSSPALHCMLARPGFMYKKLTQNPPEQLLRAECKSNTEFALILARSMPRVVVTEASAKAVAGGLTQVTLQLQNTGKKTALPPPPSTVYAYKGSFCQDRLGTNAAKTQKRVAFSHRLHAQLRHQPGRCLKGRSCEGPGARDCLGGTGGRCWRCLWRDGSSGRQVGWHCGPDGQRAAGRSR
jgi:hypothetical protein